ncbi:hypothetical protein [Ketogulonicigenium vulgare]|uniref:Uncharacterized protein n=1 Tax=Ketogulonicigenium vulgare (strain WSH-001) TaxID=759362 RepID=F9Y679_KETVW|nr:hypothetical protein [Ketogulonicigenium vulgare]ADO43813.1 hypothetical protein EIO_2739 [Ketogulonicigenium vulgare Y25]AEM42076.1 hypothetical protein KVU_2237 [Ketogulonicigenium vulgare WSH-001]ALJ82169.1 hypothetical protein KVH_13945 [Ketogulonicigenium vulgare]ANW35222.1 hypothetical protein KvSKV_13855 [Ketogulonicigenium vulgare]AOZ55847.1 hypothetical protein KVC_2845 [Ketogulonicigenium vulgare]
MTDAPTQTKPAAAIIAKPAAKAQDNKAACDAAEKALAQMYGYFSRAA